MQSTIKKDAVRKSYSTPTLKTYGSVKALTNAAGSNGLMDGGTAQGTMMTRM